MTEPDLVRLYADFGYALFRRCLLYLGDPASAQDAVQEVFERAVRASDRLAGEADPRAWLCRTADDLCVARLRGPQHRVRALDDAATVASQPVAAAIQDDDRESFLTLARLLAGLDPEARRLSVLYYLDEHTPEEIAAELGVSRRAVDKRIGALERHARARLAEGRSA